MAGRVARGSRPHVTITDYWQRNCPNSGAVARSRPRWRTPFPRHLNPPHSCPARAHYWIKDGCLQSRTATDRHSAPFQPALQDWSYLVHACHRTSYAGARCPCSPRLCHRSRYPSSECVKIETHFSSRLLCASRATSCGIISRLRICVHVTE